MLGLLQIEAKFVAFWEREYLGNTYERWAIALAVLVVTFIALGLLKRLVHRHLKRLADRTSTDVDDLLADLVKRTKPFFLFVCALWIAHHTLDWSLAAHSVAEGASGATDAKPDPTLGVSKVELAIQYLWHIGFWLQVGFWGIGLVQYGIARLVQGKSADDPARTMGVTVLSFIGHTIVWTVVMLSCLQALNFPVTSLIASLGVGGIAVALALQNVLGDLFASIAILLDKPFIVGDGIQVGEFVGNIERIGVKTTRLRSVNGEEIVMGNNDLVSSRIRNFKRLNERRIVLALGIEYDTPVAVVERIPSILKEIVEGTPETRFDRAHFKGFGDSALQFEAVYFSLVPEYVAMMNVQQSVNLNILRRFEAERIAFAFPTQTVRHVVRGADVAPTGVPDLDIQVQAVAAHAMKKNFQKPD